MITETTTKEPFDADAVFNKLTDCVNDEIYWTYKPDGYKEFHKWLNDEIGKVIQQAFSEGRKAGLKEMDEAVSETFNVAQFPNEKILKLRQEYQSPNNQ